MVPWMIKWYLFFSILARDFTRLQGKFRLIFPWGPPPVPRNRWRRWWHQVAWEFRATTSHGRIRFVTSATIGICTITGSSKCVHFAPFHPTALLNGRHFTDQTSRYIISIGVPVRQRCPNPPLQSIWKISDSTGYVEQHSSVSTFGVVRTPKFKNLAPSSKNVP